jgi:hypothetical protein
MQKTNTKGLKFINSRKAVVNLVMHADIMEDAIDRIKVKEAMNTGQFIDWGKALKVISARLPIGEGTR